MPRRGRLSHLGTGADLLFQPSRGSQTFALALLIPLRLLRGATRSFVSLPRLLRLQPLRRLCGFSGRSLLLGQLARLLGFRLTKLFSTSHLCLKLCLPLSLPFGILGCRILGEIGWPFRSWRRLRRLIGRGQCRAALSAEFRLFLVLRAALGAKTWHDGSLIEMPRS